MTTQGARDAQADQVWTLDRVQALGLTTDLETAATILGIGRTLAYELAKTNSSPSASCASEDEPESPSPN
jgi:hypothetical protein